MATPATQESRSNETPSPAKVRLAEWFAGYKKTPLPSEVRASNRAWWAWISQGITRIDREDAHSTRYDFHLDVDLDDVGSIIGALKYRAEAQKSDPKVQAANDILLGIHPYTAQDLHDLTDLELDIAIRIAYDLQPSFEIDWGSV